MAVFASLTDFQEEDAPTPPAALGVPGSPDPLALFSEDGICLDPYELDTGLRKQVTPARDLTGCMRAPPLETCEAMGPVSMHLTEEVSAMHGTAVILTPPSALSPPDPTDANRNAIPDVWAELDLIDQLICKFAIIYFSAVYKRWMREAWRLGLYAATDHGVASEKMVVASASDLVQLHRVHLGNGKSFVATPAMVKEQAAERYIQIPHTILRKDLAIVCTVLQTKVYWPVSTTKQRITDDNNSLPFGSTHGTSSITSLRTRKIRPTDSTPRLAYPQRSSNTCPASRRKRKEEFRFRLRVASRRFDLTPLLDGEVRFTHDYHFITMSPKVLTQAPLLRAMQRMNPQQRVTLLKTANKKLIDSVCNSGAVEKCAEDQVTRSQAGFAQDGQTRRVLEEEETTTRSETRSVHALTFSPFNQWSPRFLIQQVDNGTHEKYDIGVPGILHRFEQHHQQVASRVIVGMSGMNNFTPNVQLEKCGRNCAVFNRTEWQELGSYRRMCGDLMVIISVKQDAGLKRLSYLSLNWVRLCDVWDLIKVAIDRRDMLSTPITRYYNDLIDTHVVDVYETLKESADVVDLKQPTVKTHIRNLDHISASYYIRQIIGLNYSMLEGFVLRVPSDDEVGTPNAVDCINRWALPARRVYPIPWGSPSERTNRLGGGKDRVPATRGRGGREEGASHWLGKTKVILPAKRANRKKGVDYRGKSVTDGSENMDREGSRL
uniref:Uncharacterized protein n=1 Tax=Timema shepardi TaxID=629360 RepID=A0A7R9B5F5_TIMSH|nr:unnamed protein product [Timema shepardi]